MRTTSSFFDCQTWLSSPRRPTCNRTYTQLNYTQALSSHLAQQRTNEATGKYRKRHLKEQLAIRQDYDARDYINEHCARGLQLRLRLDKYEECNDTRKIRKNGAVNGGGWWLV